MENCAVYQQSISAASPSWWAAALCARCLLSGWSPTVLCLGAAPPPAPPHPPALSSAARCLSSGPPPSTTSSLLLKLSGLCGPRRPWCLWFWRLHQHHLILEDVNPNNYYMLNIGLKMNFYIWCMPNFSQLLQLYRKLKWIYLGLDYYVTLYWSNS